MSSTNVVPYSILQSNTYVTVTPGAIAINANYGAFYIYGSTWLVNYGLENLADKYALFPGYSILVEEQYTNLVQISQRNSTGLVQIINMPNPGTDYYVWLWYGNTVLNDPTTGSSVLNGFNPPPQPV
jgi:hypothetical protein